MHTTVMEALRTCMENASRVNPESRHRQLLRQLLSYHSLSVGEALLVLDRVASLDLSHGPVDVTVLVRDARAAMQPLWAERDAPE